jgi:hypothetical protein
MTQQEKIKQIQTQIIELKMLPPTIKTKETIQQLQQSLDKLLNGNQR